MTELEDRLCGSAAYFGTMVVSNLHPTPPSKDESLSKQFNLLFDYSTWRQQVRDLQAFISDSVGSAGLILENCNIILDFNFYARKKSFRFWDE